MQYNDIKTTSDYCAYVKDTAAAIVESAIEHIKEDLRAVEPSDMRYCDLTINAAEIRNYIECRELVDYRIGVARLLTSPLYWAFYADVSEHISGCCADVLAKGVK